VFILLLMLSPYDYAPIRNPLAHYYQFLYELLFCLISIFHLVSPAIGYDFIYIRHIRPTLGVFPHTKQGHPDNRSALQWVPLYEPLQ